MLFGHLSPLLLPENKHFDCAEKVVHNLTGKISMKSIKHRSFTISLCKSKQGWASSDGVDFVWSATHRIGIAGRAWYLSSDPKSSLLLEYVIVFSSLSVFEIGLCLCSPIQWYIMKGGVFMAEFEDVIIQSEMIRFRLLDNAKNV